MFSFSPANWRFQIQVEASVFALSLQGHRTLSFCVVVTRVPMPWKQSPRTSCNQPRASGFRCCCSELLSRLLEPRKPLSVRDGVRKGDGKVGNSTVTAEEEK